MEKYPSPVIQLHVTYTEIVWLSNDTIAQHISITYTVQSSALALASSRSVSSTPHGQGTGMVRDDDGMVAAYTNH